MKAYKLGDLVKELGFFPIFVTGNASPEKCPGSGIVEFKGVREQIGINILREFVNEIVTFFRFFFYLKKKKNLLKYCAAVQIHSISPFLTQYYALKVAKKNGKPVVYVMHDLIVETVETLLENKPFRFVKPLVLAVANWFENKIVGSSDATLVVSESMKKIISIRHKINPEKIGLIPPILEENWLNQQKQREETKKKKPHEIEMIYVGKLEPVIRGIENILKAAYSLKKLGYRNWKVKIVGDGEYLNETRKLVEKMGLTDKIIFTGKIDHKQVAEHIVKADIALLLYPKTKATEVAFPTKLLEYMAAGKIIIASELSKFKKILGNNAVFVDPNSVSEIVKNTVKTIENLDTHREKAKKLKALAKKYLWENAKDSVKKQYKMVLTGNQKQNQKI